MNDNLRDYVEKWLFRANEDLAVIDSLIQTEAQAYASTICFHAQQAVEKYLKALLAWKGVDFPRTHDVDFLLAECRKVSPGQFDQIDLKSLTDFGVSIATRTTSTFPTFRRRRTMHESRGRLVRSCKG